MTADTRAALDAAIDAHTAAAIADAGALGAPETWAAACAAAAALDRAIAAHVAAEVARALEAAPEVEAAIVDYAHAVQGDFDAHDERNALRAAIAADRARAVAKARPTPDEARRLLDEYDRATRHSYVTGGPEHLRAARTALLRALGVEA